MLVELGEGLATSPLVVFFLASGFCSSATGDVGCRAALICFAAFEVLLLFALCCCAGACIVALASVLLALHEGTVTQTGMPTAA